MNVAGTLSPSPSPSPSPPLHLFVIDDHAVVCAGVAQLLQGLLPGWEAQWYLFAAMFLLGAGCVFLHDQQVRIDVISGRLSRRTQVWIDIIGIALFLMPLSCYLVWTALPSLQAA